MLFKASHPSDFKSGQISPGVQGELTIANPIVGDVPAFQVSGTGEALAHGSESSISQPEPAASAPPSASTARPPAQTIAGDTSDRSRRELWFMVSGMVVIVIFAVFAFWRIKRRSPVATAAPQKSVLDALKEELFQLESDRLRGAVSAEDYAATRKVLNQSIKRLTAQ